ncbi:MAG: glycosyltransferase family 4 protein [Rikenellaceae bacterium]
MLKRRIRVGYIGYGDPKDRGAVSGITYMICRAMESMGAEVVWIPSRRTWHYKLKSALCKLKWIALGYKGSYNHSLSASRELARSIDREQLKGFDLYLCINSCAVVAGLELDRPLIYRSDTTFNLMVDYYFHNLSRQTIAEGNALEQRVLDMSSAVIYPSMWAKRSAISDFNQPEAKLHVVESGANIDSEMIGRSRASYDGKELNLIFIGVSWQRKGGDIALDACRYLHEKGLNVKLHIIGIKRLDERIKALPYVNHVGFLSKNNKEQCQQFVDLMLTSHAMLLPTRAECAGIAFCESSAYGLPSFTHDTGGVGNYVVNGVNGYRLPLGSTGADFGEKIYECLQSGELERLSQQAVELYEERLNWQVWQRRVEKIIDNII